MINRDKVVKTVIDIGNGKIKAITGELSSNGEVLKVLRYIEGPSSGMIKNEIRDGEALSKSVNDVIERLREDTEQEIESITIGISGESIKSRTVNMEYNFSEEEVTEEHIKALLLEAEKKVLIPEEQIIKTEIYNMRVDNSGIVKNPLGILGSKLQGDVHLIYTDKKRVAKLVETINRISVDVENIVLNAYASAKATLGEEDKRMGVALADIGEGSTDIILYKNDKLIYTKTIPLGGMHFKSDLVYILKLADENDAIEILNKYKDKIIAVRGNCDSEVDQMVLSYPIMSDYSMIYLGNKRVFLTHGHIYNIDNPLPMSEGDILLYGHFHIPMIEKKGERYFFNPGSISLPKNNSNHSFAILDETKFQIKDLDENILMEINF